jgi:SAM-dependent methyltransferase
MNEMQSVQERYARRKSIAHSIYDPLRPVNVAFRQEKQKYIAALILQWLAGDNLQDKKILEIGCGNGSNLLELILFGASPERITANELLEDRLVDARRRLPAASVILPGNALEISIEDHSFDIIVQSTVFSSILDDDFRIKLAAQMMKKLRPGGAILWYDFVVNNPKNQDVRGVPMRDVKNMFPGCTFQIKRLTLAPPLARRLGALTAIAYPILGCVPFLKTHILCLITNPER